MDTDSRLMENCLNFGRLSKFWFSKERKFRDSCLRAFSAYNDGKCDKQWHFDKSGNWTITKVWIHKSLMSSEAVERVVKLVSESVEKVLREDSRDRFIRTTLVKSPTLNLNPKVESCLNSYSNCKCKYIVNMWIL